MPEVTVDPGEGRGSIFLCHPGGSWNGNWSSQVTEGMSRAELPPPDPGIYRIRVPAAFQSPFQSHRCHLQGG